MDAFVRSSSFPNLKSLTFISSDVWLCQSRRNRAWTSVNAIELAVVLDSYIGRTEAVEIVSQYVRDDERSNKVYVKVTFRARLRGSEMVSQASLLSTKRKLKGNSAVHTMSTTRSWTSTEDDEETEVEDWKPYSAGRGHSMSL